MIHKLRLYISAAPDLSLERDLLVRSITEIPTLLGWTIKQTFFSLRQHAGVAGEFLSRKICAPFLNYPVQTRRYAEWRALHVF